MIRFLAFVSAAVLALPSFAAEPTFRTDESTDEKLPWFELQPGKFPPENSAHSFSGELIHVNYTKRQFILRNDRNDKQNRGNFDLPVAASMLPYGSIYYHGAPAALQDIPLGTHLHGKFYLRPKDDASKLIDYNTRVSNDAAFTRCLVLEDDFSHYARLQQLWRIESVNLDGMRMTAVLTQDGDTVGEPKTFDLQASTRVWKGRGFENVEFLEKGQLVQFNITWATMYGPGRVTDVWVDEASRNFASAHQMAKHRIYIRQRGLAGWIDAVDNPNRTMTVTFFGGVDPSLFKEISKGESVGNAVAVDTLQTYDPVNDRKGGVVQNVLKVPLEVGSSGVQIEIKVDQLLEGFRPGRIIRVFPGTWPVVPLPLEEHLGLMQ
jgi:hypothetical protein